MWIGRKIWDKPKGFGEGKCARCGQYCKLTIDHFIPKRCGMTVNGEGNYVGICEKCNRDKGGKIVTPDWYKYLDEKKKPALERYMRYAGSWIRSNTDDPEVLDYLEKIKLQAKNHSVDID